MQGKFERTYGVFLKYIVTMANPFKKVIIRTECQIHKFINLQALDIIKNDNFLDAHSFFSDYTAALNDGVTWADQNFKSMGHFYNPIKNKGLYGNKNALLLANEYYAKSLMHWTQNQPEMSIFYLGAALHLVQDMTVPQHVNIRLLDSHRRYENYIKRIYMSSPELAVYRGGYYVESIEEAVRSNAHNTLRIYSRLKGIKDDEKRYYSIARYTLPLAQKTTAGCLMRFYRDIGKHHFELRLDITQYGKQLMEHSRAKST
ncbi:phospholipase C [Anaerobacterium chartisolvens]|uniref:Phospholipase C n=1 Tax=Anaerobacterium chartisolvens TaxID=1297424 RepID=A0A369BJX5_9FIRM|nr:zinc dependent phospholipase C family protein [Anaerobacterium chartisolvens]RCX20004.1 phospholipase C [Anaerobacterium chartisolvens]